MLIIAERINASRKSITQAISSQDIAFIQNEAKKQDEAGGDYIDVNAGTFAGDVFNRMEPGVPDAGRYGRGPGASVRQLPVRGRAGFPAGPGSHHRGFNNRNA